MVFTDILRIAELLRILFFFFHSSIFCSGAFAAELPAAHRERRSTPRAAPRTAEIPSPPNGYLAP